MKRMAILSAFLLIAANHCWAQASGNISYSSSGGSARAKANERSKRALVPAEAPPSATTMFIEANVLMNVKADEYVVVFGIAHEGATLVECSQKMDTTITDFSAELRKLSISSADVFVDFAAQNKIYGFQLVDYVAKEKLVGFELKKNVAIHYRDPRLLDPIVLAASRVKVFDLIKVDYLVKDLSQVQNRLVEEAAEVIKQKATRYEKLFGVKLTSPPQIYAEKPSLYFPTEMYDSYQAYEAEEMNEYSDRQRYTIQRARKSQTTFFNGLTADGFDRVINPVMIEPVVQCTLYLKVKYEMETGKPK